MKVIPVPVLSDNYSYLVCDTKSKIALAIDPAEHQTVLDAAKKEGVEIKKVLTTHHHWDHAGGNKEMAKALPDAEIYGGDDRVDALTHKVHGGDSFMLGTLQIKVHFTPCHTRGHVLYEILDTDQPNKSHVIFTGDTLFIGGCGRFFEGTPQEMYHALIEVLAKLPPDTLVYCGHEYTEKNLEFAKTLEPNNEQLREKLAWTKQQRANKLPTIPSTIGEELSYNPFMRVNQKPLMDVVGQTDPIEVMREVRARKDHF